MFGYSFDHVRAWYAGTPLFAHRVHGGVWSCAFRRSVIEANHLRFDTRIVLYEDAMFNCAYMLHAQRMTCVDEPLYDYHLAPTGAMTRLRRSGRELANKLELLRARKELDAKYKCVMIGAGNAPRIYRQMGDYPIDIVGNYGMQVGGNFKGTFDGAGRTLTFNAGSEASPMNQECVAPFYSLQGAMIKNLRVAGTITTDNKMAAGIVSHMKRTTLEDCVSSVTIISSVSGDGTHGGVVGVIESGAGNSGVRGCVFDGVICCTAANLTHSCGGIAGWKEVGTKTAAPSPA